VTSSIPTYAILVDRATDAQLQAVHQAVKDAANGWWHRFTNVWLVGGKTAVEWRDLLKPLVSAPGSVLVVRVDGSQWAMSGPDVQERAAWLHKNL
jgi:hypothetical protein